MGTGYLNDVGLKLGCRRKSLRERRDGVDKNQDWRTAQMLGIRMLCKRVVALKNPPQTFPGAS